MQPRNRPDSADRTDNPSEPTDFTDDTFFNGLLCVKQQRTGYRFSIDAVILADHVRPREDERILELGTGCGIVLLMLAFRNPKAHYFGVEIQSDLYKLAAENVKRNQMQGCIRLFGQNMTKLKPGLIDGPVDMVISNPPYRKIDSGRINPNHQKAVARHEIKLTLSDLFSVVRRMLRTAGRFVAVYTAERTSEFMLEMKTAGIEPKYLRVVYSAWNTEAKLILIEGVKGARSGCKIGPPLVVYNDDGTYTDEVAEMFKP